MMPPDFHCPFSGFGMFLLRFKFERFFPFFAAATAAVEGKMSKTLKKLMKKLVSSDTQEELAVADAKLGNLIKVRSNRVSNYVC